MQTNTTEEPTSTGRGRSRGKAARAAGDDGDLPDREPSSRLVIVANRLPVHQVIRGGRKRWETSPGGLVSALAPFVQRAGGAWVGWPGFPNGSTKPFRHEGIDHRIVRLSEEELEGFYYGFSNATLWPLYHDAIRPPVFRRTWWREYVKVNRKYAEATAKTLKDGETVWVHDYQLQLVPAMLRELKPNVRIGFFLHIPFPPEEIFARIPWREEILKGLLGSDLIGFQTALGAQNFARSARRFTTARSRPGGGTGSNQVLEFEGHTARVSVFPISIDIEHFVKAASSSSVKQRAAQLRKQLGSRRIILGVDRLDYTKGIDIRLRAFQEVLRRGKKATGDKKVTVRDCVFCQIAVPTRTSVDEYARLRRTVEEHVGRINGEYGEPALAAVHYLRRNVPFEELVALYVAADVMVVTPLRDGMNLVAKEYVACRMENTGTLVLSEFAGAAHELRTSILVNPYDIDGLARAMEEALHMNEQDERRKMAAMRRALKRNDVYDWAASFIRNLNPKAHGGDL